VSGPSPWALRTSGLVKRYGSRAALRGLDLAVPQGVVYGFLGPNGAGKTTLMRLLVGLIKADEGGIELLGQPFGWRDRKRLFGVGALVEGPTFYGYLSGRDNLRALAATGGRVGKGRVEEVLSLVGLHERAGDRVSGYSLGMKQRLGIAGALLSDPELLLLDEPANGLDPGGIVAMRRMLRALTDQGKTVFISSHILPEVQQLADVIGIVDHGRLVREGRLQDLLTEGAHVRVRVAPPEQEAALRILAGFGAPLQAFPPDATGGAWIGLRVPGTLASEVNRRLAESGIHASALESRSDLESVFLTLTASAPPAPEGRDINGTRAGWGERT
jgi:ABC-2 type transport system ATP-binding protein